MIRMENIKKNFRFLEKLGGEMEKVLITKDDHFTGNLNDKLQLLEYGDFQCPYCKEAYEQLKKVQEHFGDSLLFGFRNFPLEMHPDAFGAAMAAEVAGKYGKYWEMHGLLFENQNNLDYDGLVGMAGTLNISVDEFDKHWNTEEIINKVNSDIESGLRDGVNATPGFFVDGVQYQGSYEAEELIRFLSAAMES